jgi:hypothetical protein
VPPTPIPPPSPPPRTPSPTPLPLPPAGNAGRLLGLGGLVSVFALLGLAFFCGLAFVLPRLLSGTLRLAASTATVTRPAPTSPGPSATGSVWLTRTAVALTRAAEPSATRTATRTSAPPTATRTPQPSATPTPPAGALLFSDDFRDAASGWEANTSAARVLAYRDGAFVFEMLDDHIRSTGTSPAGPVLDAHVAVTVRAGDNAAIPYLGLVCNYQDGGQYYHLGMRPDGYYSISYYDGEAAVVLTSDRDTLEHSDAIRRDAPSYRLEADCASSGWLRLIVDGIEIASVFHTAYTQGEVGLTAGSYNTVPVAIYFDDMEVRGRPAPEVLLAEDFSTTTGGWSTGTNENRALTFQDESYVIEMFNPDFWVWSSPDGPERSHLRLAVTVRGLGLVPTGFAGLMCHRQSGGAHYFLGLDGEGDYLIRYYDGEASNFLATGDYTQPLNPDANRLAADCAADGTLRLILNGVEIASAVDRTLTSGFIGFFAWSDDEVPHRVTFDDLLVTQLP